MVKFNLMRKQYIIKGTVIFILLIGTFFNLNAQEVNIFDIAREGSLVQLKKVIEKDTNVINKINKSGYSPLTLACYYGNNEVAKYLIENIKDINSNSGYGTALMAAVVKKNVELTRFLLEHKADPNIADSNGTTAMHYAVIFENLDLNTQQYFQDDIDCKDIPSIEDIERPEYVTECIDPSPTPTPTITPTNTVTPTTYY